MVDIRKDFLLLPWEIYLQELMNLMVIQELVAVVLELITAQIEEEVVQVSLLLVT